MTDIERQNAVYHIYSSILKAIYDDEGVDQQIPPMQLADPFISFEVGLQKCPAGRLDFFPLTRVATSPSAFLGQPFLNLGQF